MHVASLHRDHVAVGSTVPITCSLSPLLGQPCDGECPESSYRGDDQVLKKQIFLKYGILH